MMEQQSRPMYDGMRMVLRFNTNTGAFSREFPLQLKGKVDEAVYFSLLSKVEEALKEYSECVRAAQAEVTSGFPNPVMVGRIISISQRGELALIEAERKIGEILWKFNEGKTPRASFQIIRTPTRGTTTKSASANTVTSIVLYFEMNVVAEAVTIASAVPVAAATATATPVMT